jgi:GT2 family glycosyltransferase
LDSAPSVSVIILNWNGKRHLERCLPSLRNTNYPSEKIELIVVDNKSSDGSKAFVRNFFPEIIFLELDKNYGFTGGNNRGAEVAHGELLVFLNNDTLVDDNWLVELVKVANNDKQIGICGSKILFEERRNIVQYAGGFLNTLGGGVSPFVYTEDTGMNDTKLTGYVCGACLLIRRDVFEKLGGFDEDYFMYSDENDLCLRCWLLGYNVVYVPKSIVYHKGEGSIKLRRQERGLYTQIRDPPPMLQGRLISDMRLYYSNRNSLSNIWKNLEPRNVLFGTVFSGVLCGYQLFSLLKQKTPAKILIVLKGLFSFLRSLPKVLVKRWRVQSYRVSKDQDLLNKGVMLSLGSLIAIAFKH